MLTPTMYDNQFDSEIISKQLLFYYTKRVPDSFSSKQEIVLDLFYLKMSNSSFYYLLP
jgi:hypothetical protein